MIKGLIETTIEPGRNRTRDLKKKPIHTRPIGAILEMAIHNILRSAKRRRYRKGIRKELTRIDMTTIDGPILKKPHDGISF